MSQQQTVNVNELSYLDNLSSEELTQSKILLSKRSTKRSEIRNVRMYNEAMGVISFA